MYTDEASTKIVFKGWYFSKYWVVADFDFESTKY